MSEKGQGEESAVVTGVAAPERTDGGSATATAPSGGGNQADQTGPDQDALGGLTPRDFPEPAESGPDVTDESNPFDDIEFPTAEENLRAMETGEPLELPRTKLRRPSPDHSPDPPQSG